MNVAPVLSFVRGDWQKFLAGALLSEGMEDMRKHARKGRPLGSPPFVERLEGMLGRKLKPQKPGRKPQQKLN